MVGRVSPGPPERSHAIRSSATPGRAATPPPTLTPMSALTGPPATTVDEVVVRMEGIDAELPAGDGLGAFNQMYLLVTKAVRDRIGAAFFADAAFMTALDVTF